MAGFIQAIATDLDGTLTTDGQVGPDLLAAIDECRDRGLVVLLVTGRIRAELDQAMPGLAAHFDLVVYENGAVLGEPGTRGEPVATIDPMLRRALRDRGIKVRSGEVILAGDGADAVAVSEEIARLGLDEQVVSNRGQMMVLPAGVSKGTGLRAGLAGFDISVHNVVAIGDAENDLSMLETAELAVAVGDAIESVRRHADLVLDGNGGAAVAAFLRGPVIGGTTVIHSPRRAQRIGETAEGQVLTVPGAQATVLIRGGTGSGKSRLAGLLLERWISAGYTVLVIDPEGDHSALGRLPRTVVIDSIKPPPIGELLQLLRQQHLSVVLDLSGFDPQQAQAFLSTIALAVETTRSRHGLPHWIAVDEAHGPLGEQGVITSLFRPGAGGYCYITYHPEALCVAALSSVDVTLTTLGEHRPDTDLTGTPGLYRETGRPEQVFLMDERRTPHVRHRHKYLSVPLPEQDRFIFRDQAGSPIETACTVEEFTELLMTVPDRSIEHHVLNGDFSRWAVAALQDRQLGTLINGAEDEFSGHLATAVRRARAQLLDSLRQRYQPPDG